MAGFRTAYLQREIYEDVAVVGNTKVGDFVQYVAANGAVPAYIKKSTIANATHIVAQSDMTLGYGHVPVENRNYKYDSKVAYTLASGTPTAATPIKHVALFKITNMEDILPDADGNDHV